MMARPWARATAVMPLRPAPPPTTAAAPAPMNTNEKVPMNSARSLGAIRLDMLVSRDEIGRLAQSGLRQGDMRWVEVAAARERAGGRKSERRYSAAATVCGLNLIPIAFATPAPYAGSALSQWT